MEEIFLYSTVVNVVDLHRQGKWICFYQNETAHGVLEFLTFPSKNEIHLLTHFKLEQFLKFDNEEQQQSILNIDLSSRENELREKDKLEISKSLMKFFKNTSNYFHHLNKMRDAFLDLTHEIFIRQYSLQLVRYAIKLNLSWLRWRQETQHKRRALLGWRYK